MINEAKPAAANNDKTSTPSADAAIALKDKSAPNAGKTDAKAESPAIEAKKV
jgi:hypothetical protein